MMNKLCLFGAIATAVGAVITLMTKSSHTSNVMEYSGDELESRLVTRTDVRKITAKIEQCEVVCKENIMSPELKNFQDDITAARQQVKKGILAANRIMKNIYTNNDIADETTGELNSEYIVKFNSLFRKQRDLYQFIYGDIVYNLTGINIFNMDNDEDEDVEGEDYVEMPAVYQDEDDYDDFESDEPKKKKKKDNKRKTKKTKKNSKKKKVDKKKSSKKKKRKKKEDEVDPYSMTVDELEKYYDFDIRAKIPDTALGHKRVLWELGEVKRDEPDKYAIYDLDEFLNHISDLVHNHNEDYTREFMRQSEELIYAIKNLLCLKILFEPKNPDYIDSMVETFMNKLDVVRSNLDMKYGKDVYYYG